MANWSNPLLTSTYTDFMNQLKDRDVDLALQFDGTTSSNLTTGTIRWNSSINRWQKWNGTAWAELTTIYALTGLSTTGNGSIGGTLGVTGATTLSTATATTPATADNSTAIATTAWVRAQNFSVSTSGNRIINGSMQIDQRNSGAAQTFTAAAALAYNVDRWYGYCTGANVTGQRVQGASVGQFRYRFTGAASVTAIGFGQRIEQLNIADLVSTTARLSVDLANSVLTSVTWTAFYANTADTFGTLASPTRTQIATGTFTVNSTVTRYSTSISVPAAATTGIEIVFTVGAQTSGTWTIGDVQLEPGAVSTAFERRPFGLELALCQRYFWRGGNDIALNFPSYVTGSVMAWTVFFPATLRVTPTLTSSLTGTTYSFTNSLAWNQGTKDQGRLILDSTAANPNANFATGASDWIAASAEL